MYDYLKDHALRNVWCTPDQDNQLIIKPARLTAGGGVTRKFRVVERSIDLPDNTSHWHIYQIGQIHPLIIGLLPKTDRWVSFAYASNAKKMVCDLYVDTGVQYPRFETYYMYNSDRDLIIAVRDNKKLQLDFNNDAFYLRLYTNAYFNTNRSDLTVDTIHVEGGHPKSVEQVVALQDSYLKYKAKVGHTTCFVNGFEVSDIDLITAKVGDTVEFVYDASIYKIIDFRVDDLRTFESTLDEKRKYLLHYSGSDSGSIDYRDDIDVYILNPQLAGRHFGVFYHKNSADSLRMVTHRDYSVVVPYVVGYAKPIQLKAGNSVVIDPKDLYVRLLIRKSGYLRPLIFENNRIHELYKMTDDNVRRAMLGIDSVVSNWRAEVLENSDYVKIMDSKCCDITNLMVQNAYGYNSISRIIGDTPQVPYAFSSRLIVDVPYGIQIASTVYEYDADGYMIGWYVHNVGSVYACRNPNAALVEIISGIGSNYLGDTYDFDNIPVDNQQSFRVYYNSLNSLNRPSDWIDVTDTDKYVVANGKLQRSDNSLVGIFLVRTEARFIAFDLSLPMKDGQLRFNLHHIRKLNGVDTLAPLDVPLGKVDVFLNKKSLIRDLDYFVIFPEIVIVNKEYLDNPLQNNQQIHVRHTGYCDETLRLEDAADFGFIKHGVLSENNKFDIRDDRVLRIVADGSVYTRQELIYSETNDSVSTYDARNGQPYVIDDIVVPLKWITTEPTYKVRGRSRAIDKVVSDYLTLKNPQQPITTLSVIKKRYAIFSPFVCKIIYDLATGVFDKAIIKVPYQVSDIPKILVNYLHLLPADPTQQDQRVDDNFVIIHPHNLDTVVDIDLISYRFIEKVVKYYTNDLITLSPFLRLTPI